MEVSQDLWTGSGVGEVSLLGSGMMEWMMRDRLCGLNSVKMFGGTRVNKSGRSASFLSFAVEDDGESEGKFEAGRRCSEGYKAA